MSNNEDAIITDYILNKRVFYAGLITIIVTFSAITGIIIYYRGRPLVSTSYYHFNLQYRAGDETTYHEIVENSFQYIIWMHGNHSTWHYSVECQLMLIEFVYANYPHIFEAIKSQNQNGQLELIIPQYSNSFQVPYPSKDFRESLNYTKNRFVELGLTQSKLVLLQEGQWLPGLAQVLDGNPNLHAAIISKEQCRYFNVFPQKTILNWTLFGKSMYAFVIPWVPVVENGVYWHMIYTQDGEKINTGGAGVNIGVANEFSFNPDKQANLEARHVELEKKGNKFLTLTEFYDSCFVNGEIDTLTHFIPETEWVAASYKQYYTWMGDNSGSMDDGLMLARIYHTRNLIQAADVFLEECYHEGAITDLTYQTQKALLLSAKKYLWEAMVTDTTGISPREIEGEYGLNKTKDAMDIAQNVISFLKTVKSYSQSIQIVPYNQTIFTNPVDFVDFSFVRTSDLAEIQSEFGLELMIDQSYDSVYPPQVNYSVITIPFNNSIFTLYRINVGFRGQYNINITRDTTLDINFGRFSQNLTTGISGSNDIAITFKDDWKKAIYSPALAENYSIELRRDDYLYRPYGSKTEWLFLMSLCNGFLYNPQSGYAIIKDCTTYHLAAKWNNDQMVFRTEDVKYNHHQQYYLVKGSVTELLGLANFINTYQWMVV